MVLDNPIRFFIWHGSPRHDGEQRLFIVLREHQLVACQTVVVVIVKEVIFPQRRDFEVAKEASLVGGALQIVNENVVMRCCPSIRSTREMLVAELSDSGI